MENHNGLFAAFLLEPKSNPIPLDWNGVRAWESDQGPLWIHLLRTDSGSEKWLRDETGLDALVCDALLIEETRPRSMVQNHGIMVILRGVNMNPGADPEDMVSVRIGSNCMYIV